MTVATVVPPGFSLIENDVTHVRRIWPTSALGYITGWTVVQPTDPQPTVDVYPGAVDDTELDGDVAALIPGPSATAAALRAAYVSAVVDSSGGVTLYQNGVEL